jgi:hypothetical protein
MAPLEAPLLPALEVLRSLDVKGLAEPFANDASGRSLYRWPPQVQLSGGRYRAKPCDQVAALRRRVGPPHVTTALRHDIVPTH